MKASRRLFVDFVHGDGVGAAVVRAWASIWPHLLAAGACLLPTRGRNKPQNHAQIAKYRHEELGYNYRMDEMQGAILGVKLRHLDAWNDAEERQLSDVLSVIDAAIRTLPD